MDGFPPKENQPGVVVHDVTMVGTGASAPTKVFGQGVTITRTGAGDYRLTWGANPGTYLRTAHSLRAATETDVKNHSVIIGAWDATNWTLDVCFFDASAAAHDLAASEWIELGVRFKTTSG